jgi:hypothetical protein
MSAARPDLADEVWYDAEAGPVVRLFALTRGRVTVGPRDADLGLATLVSTAPGATGLEELSPEQDEILRLCVRPVSVAEVAAHLRMPVSSARVLLADLRGAGLLSTGGEPVAGDGREGPEPGLLGKVLAGLREL